MAQNNLFMDDDDMRLYIDVQPLFIDELENSKNSAAASALRAAQSEEAAKGWKNDIEDYKTGLELFYARATDGITNSYNTSISGLSAAKNSAISDLTLQKNSIQTNLNNSLNSAIVSIRTNGQSYVNQAQYYAEEAQRTVDNRVSTDHLNQSKGLLTGFVSTDEEVFADVQKYAHSTFDLSKFTVVGSPNITSDGIASGFSSSDYLTKTIDYTSASTWELRIPFKTGADVTNAQRPIDNNAFGATSIFIQISGGKAQLGLSINSTPILTTANGVFDVVPNTNYLVKIGYDGRSYYWKYNAGESDIEGNVVPSDILLGTSLTHRFGCSFEGTSQVFTGSIDLRQFSITVDGVEVFNGNKTGIDTIKPNNYTVVGTPTISSDGVASGFSSGNYLRTNSLTFDSTKSYTIDLPFEYIIPSANKFIYSATTVYTDLSVFNYPDGKVGLYFCGKGTSIPSNYLTEEQRYLLKLHYNNLQLYLELYDVTGNLVVTTKDSPIIYTDAFSKTFNIDIGNDDDFISKERVDLNAFKIYVDGDLVYQPCLKIPYTESKTGSKIVDSIYRDRVNDMAEQFGYANYYTLDEDNGNFTLPKGEVYGMIEKLRELIIQRTS